MTLEFCTEVSYKTRTFHIVVLCDGVTGCVTGELVEILKRIQQPTSKLLQQRTNQVHASNKDRVLSALTCISDLVMYSGDKTAYCLNI